MYRGRRSVACVLEGLYIPLNPMTAAMMAPRMIRASADRIAAPLLKARIVATAEI